MYALRHTIVSDLNRFYFLADRKMVTFDVHSARRPETANKSTPYTTDGTSFVDDTMTVTSGKEPSVISSSSQTSQPSRSFISLKPTEQVMKGQGHY